MKKAISLMLAFVLCLSLCACGTSSRSDIDNYLEMLSDSTSFQSFMKTDYATSYQKYSGNKYFKDAILAKLAEYETLEDPEGKNPQFASNKAIRLVGALNALGYDDTDITNAFQQLIIKKLDEYTSVGDFGSISRMICLLDEFHVQNDVIKNQFQSILTNIQKKVFSGNGSLSMRQYIENANRILTNGSFTGTSNTESNSYYATVLECYPYDEMTSFIITNGEAVVSTIGLGGHYDNLINEYENKSYWYDPLSKTKLSIGEVGTYEHKEEYLFAGDFMVKITSTYWYMTSADDPNNKLEAGLWYKEDLVSRQYQTITAFLGMVTDTNCFYFDDVFYILEKDIITVFDGDLFTIAYEGNKETSAEVNYQKLLRLLENSSYTNNAQAYQILLDLGEYEDAANILQSFEYVKQGNAPNDVLVYNSCDCYEGTSFPTLEFYLGQAIPVQTSQWKYGVQYRYENGAIGSTDYRDSDGFLFRYGFTRKSAKSSGAIYYIFFDDMGNALWTSLVSSSGGWYTDVSIIPAENVQAFLDANGWTLG